jgi:predicted nucleic acid-binding Zn finger protein
LARPSELVTLKKICDKVVETKDIEEKDRKMLFNILGQRFIKAWNAVIEKRVKKYIFEPSNRTVWIVIGKQRDYLIMPAADFCTCDDFYFRVMDRQIHLCYHLIAQKLSEASHIHDTYEEGDELYEPLMREWRKAIA